MLKILFLCSGNSCRSQMAEGWTRHLKGGLIAPFSAGIVRHGLNPIAVQVMARPALIYPGSGQDTWPSLETLSLTIL